MAEETALNVEKRGDAGSAHARRLRRQGVVPGVMYSAGKEAESIQLDRHTFEQMMRHHASENVVLDLDMQEGGMNKVLLKDVQHHPLTGSVMHVDFQEISMDKILRVSIAINLLGEAVGVARDGGVMEQHLREVEVECLPGDMVESFDFDITELVIGDGLTVSMFEIDPDKFRVITDGDIAVANVAAPRVVEEDEEAEEGEELEGEEAAAAEPEVITEKKQDEDGSSGKA